MGAGTMDASAAGACGMGGGLVGAGTSGVRISSGLLAVDIHRRGAEKNKRQRQEPEGAEMAEDAEGKAPGSPRPRAEEYSPQRHGDTERTKSKAKPERTEMAEATEGRVLGPLAPPQPKHIHHGGTATRREQSQKQNPSARRWRRPRRAGFSGLLRRRSKDIFTTEPRRHREIKVKGNDLSTRRWRRPRRGKQSLAEAQRRGEKLASCGGLPGRRRL